MARLVWCAMLVFAVTAVSAQPLGKTTVDPNAPEARATEPVGAGDSRLSQPVTYEAKRKTVLSILTELSEATGVKLRAGYSSQDWQVRDRRMTIVARNLPLSALMDSIARVMHFKWDRSTVDGERRYRLFMDRKAILDCDARREREERQRVEKRRRYVADCLNADKLAEADIAKLKDSDPARYVLYRTGIASGLGALFGEVPGAAQAFLDGTELHVRPSQMSEVGQQALLRFMGAVLKLVSESGAKNREPSLEGRTLQINRPSLNTRPAFVLGVILVRGPSSEDSFGIPVIDPDSRNGRVSARQDIRQMESGDTPETPEFQAELQAALDKDTEELVTSEPLWEHPDDASLATKVKLTVQDKRLDEAQAALADSAKLSVVSDSFPSNDGRVSFPRSEIELRKALDTIQEQYGYNWAKRGALIEFQDREWLKRRAAQIPDAWLEAWRAAFKKNGTLGMDELSQIAMLSGEQLWENLASDEVLGNPDIIMQASACQDVLRFYASLTGDQRKLLPSPAGLDFRCLTIPQQAKARALITAGGTELPPELDGRIVFSGAIGTGAIASDPSRRMYTLNVALPEGLDPMSGWGVLLPQLPKPR